MFSNIIFFIFAFEFKQYKFIMIYEDKNVYYIFSSVRRYFAKDFQTTLKTEKILTQVPNSAYLRFQEKLNDKKLTGIPFSFPQL